MTPEENKDIERMVDIMTEHALKSSRITPTGHDLKTTRQRYREIMQGYAEKLYKAGCRFEVKGEWIGTEYDGYADGVPVYDVYECSVCGNEYHGDEPPSHCPDCGAKLKWGD